MASRLPEGPSGMSRYVQLASLLRHEIESGAWPVGHRLPTVQQMAADMGLARVTVRQAFAILAQEGLITTQRGRGTYVCAPSAPNEGLHAAINDPIRHPDGLQIRVLDVSRDASLPPALALAGDEGRFTRIRKIHVHDGQPFCLIDLYVAQGRFDRFAPDAVKHAKVARLLMEQEDGPLGQLHQTMTVAPADHEQARALEYAFAAPVARVIRRLGDVDGNLVYAGIFWYRGDRFVLDMTVPADVMYRYPRMLVPGAQR